MARTSSRSTLLTLPQELLTHVLARVAHKSVEDLARAKLCCKAVNAASKDGLVFNKASMEKVPLLPWQSSNESSIFAELCEKNRNPEAMYRLGMIDFLTNEVANAGDLKTENLKNAAMEGHMEASYVYGIVLISQGDGGRTQGLEVLKSTKDNRRGVFVFGRCRSRVKTLVQQLWVKDSVIRSLRAQAKSPSTLRCLNCNEVAPTKCNWPLDRNERADSVCECQLDKEFILLCNILSGDPME